MAVSSGGHAVIKDEGSFFPISLAFQTAPLQKENAGGRPANLSACLAFLQYTSRFVFLGGVGVVGRGGGNQCRLYTVLYTGSHANIK